MCFLKSIHLTQNGGAIGHTRSCRRNCRAKSKHKRSLPWNFVTGGRLNLHISQLAQFTHFGAVSSAPITNSRQSKTYKINEACPITHCLIIRLSFLVILIINSICLSVWHVDCDYFGPWCSGRNIILMVNLHSKKKWKLEWNLDWLELQSPWPVKWIKLMLILFSWKVFPIADQLSTVNWANLVVTTLLCNGHLAEMFLKMHP